MQLICAFFFANAKSMLSHDAAHNMKYEKESAITASVNHLEMMTDGRQVPVTVYKLTSPILQFGNAKVKGYGYLVTSFSNIDNLHKENQ